MQSKVIQALIIELAMQGVNATEGSIFSNIHGAKALAILKNSVGCGGDQGIAIQDIIERLNLILKEPKNDHHG